MSFSSRTARKRLLRPARCRKSITRAWASRQLALGVAVADRHAVADEAGRNSWLCCSSERVKSCRVSCAHRVVDGRRRQLRVEARQRRAQVARQHRPRVVSARPSVPSGPKVSSFQA